MTITAEFLREYDLGGEDFTALLLNRYQSGSVGRLVTVDDAGKEIAALDVSEEVRDLSACGRYLAVLYGDRVVVYNRDLQVYATLHGVEHAREVLTRSDGSVLMAGDGHGASCFCHKRQKLQRMFTKCLRWER